MTNKSSLSCGWKNKIINFYSNIIKQVKKKHTYFINSKNNVHLKTRFLLAIVYKKKKCIMSFIYHWESEPKRTFALKYRFRFFIKCFIKGFVSVPKRSRDFGFGTRSFRLGFDPCFGDRGPRPPLQYDTLCSQLNRVNRKSN